MLRTLTLHWRFGAGAKKAVGEGGRMRVRVVQAMALGVALLVALSGCGGGEARGASAATTSPPARIASPRACPGCWRPGLVTSWQWQLSGTVDVSIAAQMYDIDLFETPASVVADLHRAGRKVICYLNAGAGENWRPDAGSYPHTLLGKGLDGWPGEQWLDIRRLDLLMPLINARLGQCRAKGFDGVEFDNVDGYANDTDFPLTAGDQLRFNSALANAAHAHGLSAALKNDLDQVSALLPYFDWALDEQCFEYQECDKLTPFIAAGKPVMEVEYNVPPASFCPQASALNFNALYKRLALDMYRVSCR